MGPEAQCLVVRGGQHYGATRISIEILKLLIKGETSGWLEELSRTLQSSYPIDLTCSMNTQGRTVKKKYTYITKTLRLTLKFNGSINIQLQDVNVQGTKTNTETENTDQSKQVCKCLRHSLFLVFRNLLIFCLFFHFYFFMCIIDTVVKALRCLPLSLHSLLKTVLSLNLMVKKSG